MGNLRNPDLKSQDKIRDHKMILLALWLERLMSSGKIMCDVVNNPGISSIIIAQSPITNHSHQIIRASNNTQS